VRVERRGPAHRCEHRQQGAYPQRTISDDYVGFELRDRRRAIVGQIQLFANNAP